MGLGEMLFQIATGISLLVLSIAVITLLLIRAGRDRDT